MKSLVRYILLAVFFYIYMRVFLLLNISFNSSEGVLVGSILVLLVSFALSLATTNKIVRILIE